MSGWRGGKVANFSKMGSSLELDLQSMSREEGISFPFANKKMIFESLVIICSISFSCPLISQCQLFSRNLHRAKSRHKNTHNLQRQLGRAT